jgi:hypothetical protein
MVLIEATGSLLEAISEAAAVAGVPNGTPVFLFIWRPDATRASKRVNRHRQITQAQPTNSTPTPMLARPLQMPETQ